LGTVIPSDVSRVCAGCASVARIRAWVDMINGQNGQPFGKLQAFLDLFEHGAGRDAAMALFKFC
jgi:hypothetical protein